MRKRNPRKKSSRNSVRKLFATGLFDYNKLEPKNMLAGITGQDAYSPQPIADPFVHDAVTYKDMVGRAATFPYMKGELIVAITANQQGAQFEAYLNSLNWGELLGQQVLGVNGVDSARTMLTVDRGDAGVGLVHLHLGDDADIFAAMRHLEKNDSVMWSSPNFYQTEDPTELIPNDPDYGQQYHHPLMSNDQAWDITLGDSNIVVGITDDGVELFHSDLFQNIYTNVGEFPNDGIDNDNNGYIDDVNGWDFINGNNNPNPDLTGHAHGTHVAGIAAARTNNNTGVAGTAGGATILPLQFYNYGAWPASVINETFTYAADNGAHIVSTSYNINGWVGDPVFTAGMQYMYDNDVLHLNSAGNGSELNPARQAFHQTILVASSTSSDTLSGFTNYGTGIDIVAPGSDILSTLPGSSYGLNSGTSMAAPNAAGVAALIWSANPSWTRDQVAAQLVGTGDNIDAQNPTRVGLMGGGRVNSFNALTATLADPQVESVIGLPADGQYLDDTTIDEFTLRFDQIMDPASINATANFDLRSAGLDGVFDTADDEVLTLDYDTYMISANDILFSLADGPMNYGHYRFTINSGGVQNPFGSDLDGDGDGTGGDSYVQEFFISPPVAGIVGFDRASYLPEDTVLISVGDANATGPLTVEVTSSAGESETVTLVDAGFGRYEGMINTTAGTITQNDGVIQVSLGHELTVTYLDLDDGTGNPGSSSDMAVISNIIQFDSNDVPVNIVDNSTVTSIITIAQGGTVNDLDLQLDITHTWDGDLSATLTSPDGTEVDLFNRIGGSGDNYDNTYFDDEAALSINDGAPPFSGTYRPDGLFEDFDGLMVTGDWTLSITDSATADQGTLNSWSLFIDLTPASIGQVSIDNDGYNVGDTVDITVFDTNGITPVTVDVVSTSGDSETVTLADQGGGIYTGSILIDDGPVASDGLLQATPGISFTVTYVDPDDGQGNSVTDSVSGFVTNVIQFDSTDVPVNIIDNSTVTSIITVGQGGIINDLDLQLDITHTWDGDLSATLTSPEGTVVDLFNRIGGSGDDYDNTYFDDEAGSSINDGSPPFSGNYRPDGSFANFDGELVTGDWILSITDSASADQGTLNAWSLFIDLTPATIGQVTIDNDGYNVGETINISVFDDNGIPPISVDVVATSGDSETVMLTDAGGGLYTGSIVIDAGSVGSDGLLQAAPGDSFTVTYVDPDDGNGNSVSDSVSGFVQNVIHYISPDVPVNIVDNTTIFSTLEILDGGTVNDVNVELDITHTWAADLEVFLIGPDGTRVELFSDIGGGGDNFTDTILDDEADVLIADGSAPFTGTWRPAGNLSDFDDTSITGIWMLEITDDAGADTGTLDFWCLAIDVGDGVITPSINLQGIGQIEEGDSGLTPVDFTITLTNVSKEVVEVDYATTVAGFANPAIPGEDFIPVSDTAVFQPGQTSITVTVDVIADRFIEIDKEFGLVLSNAINGNIDNGDESVVINDDDQFEVGVSIDFGTTTSPVDVDSIGFTDDLYTTEFGMGWTAQNDFTMVERARGNALTRDLAIMQTGEFVIDIANGDYFVTTMFGAVGRIDQVDVILEGTVNSFIPAGLGPNVSVTYPVTVSDGQLTLQFDGNPGLDLYIRVAGLLVEQASNRSSGGGSDNGFGDNTGIWTNGLPASNKMIPLRSGLSDVNISERSELEPDKMLGLSSFVRTELAPIDTGRIDANVADSTRIDAIDEIGKVNVLNELIEELFV